MGKVSPLNTEFRKFIKASARDFNHRYPNFKRNKLIGYKLTRQITPSPLRYAVLPNIKKLKPQVLLQIKADRFVIKSTHGARANRVICAEKDSQGRFRDLLRGPQWYPSAHTFIQYINNYVISSNHKHKIIIEEYLGGDNQGPGNGAWIPLDFKVYVVMGKVRAITIYSRGKTQGKYMAIFDRQWNRIPKDQFYVFNNKFADFPGEFKLGSLEVRSRLIHQAEKIGRKLKTKLCRYDFYCIGSPPDEKIYFGEITPIGGGIYGHPLTQKALDILYPSKARRSSRKNSRYTGGRTRKNGKSLYYTKT